MEVELEKKKEQEKFEKKIGLLKYLVDDELDLKSKFFISIIILLMFLNVLIGNR